MPEIELSLQSPLVTLAGLDNALEKLTQIDELAKRFEKRSLSLSLEVKGGDQVMGMVANLKQLEAALRDAGKNDLADKLAGGLATAGEVAKVASAEMRILGRDLQASTLKAQAMREVWGQMTTAAGANRISSADLDRMPKVMREMKAQEYELIGLQEKLGKMGSIAGMAEAMTGLPEAAKASAAATEEAAAVHKVAAATTEAAAAEKVFTAATNESTLALLRKTESLNKKGEVTGTRSVYQSGVGQTVLDTGTGNLQKNLDVLTQFRAQFEALRAQFQDVRGKAGERTSQGQVDALMEAAQRHRQLLAEMVGTNAKYGQTSLFQTETTKANQMEADAGVMSERLKAIATAEAEAEANQKLTNAIREELAVQNQAGIVTRKTVQTSEEMIVALRQEAEAYRHLAASMQAAGRGQGSDSPGQFLTASTLATRAEAEASAREIDLARQEAQRKADRVRIDAQAAAHEAELQSFVAGGGEVKKNVERSQGGGRSVTTVAERDTAGGMREQVTLTRRWNEENEELESSLQNVGRALDKNQRSSTSAGKSMLDNIVTVTAWAASVGVLYKSLELARFAFDSMVADEAKTAPLSQAFRATGESGRALSASVATLKEELMGLSVEQGRVGADALAAGTVWAKLGMDQQGIGEATAISLKEANVAQIDAAKSAQNLGTIYTAFRMNVGGLEGVMNSLNVVSHQTGRSQEDLLEGVAKSAAFARQASMSYQELLGILGAVEQRSGRPASEFVTALRTMASAVDRPSTSDKLDKDFGFELKKPTGEAKELSMVLQEAYEMYVKLGKAGGSLLSDFGGRTQSVKLKELMDGYVDSQMLAIQAARDEGSAERENAAIRATTQSQLVSLRAEFEKLVVSITSVGQGFRLMDANGKMIFDPSMSGQIQMLVEALTNFLSLLNKLPAVLIGLAGILTVIAVRLAPIIFTMGDGTTKGNILTNTLTHLGKVWTMLGDAVAIANGEMVRANAIMATSTGSATANAAATAASAGKRGAQGFGSVGKLALGAILSEEMLVFIGISIAAEAAMTGFNALMRATGDESDQAADKLKLMNTELERTKSLLTAAQLSSRLGQTVRGTLPDLLKRENGPEQAREAAANYASVAYSREQDPEGKKTIELGKQLDALLAIGDIKSAQHLIDLASVEGQRETNRLLRLEAAQKQDLLRTNQAEVEDLRAQMANPRNDLKMEELRARLQAALKTAAQLRGEAASATSAAYGATDEPASEHDQEVSEAIKERNAQIEKMAKAYPSIGGEDKNAGKVDREIYANRAAEAELAARVEKAKAERAAAMKPFAAGKSAAEADFDPYRRILQERDEVARFDEEKRPAGVKKEEYLGPGTQWRADHAAELEAAEKAEILYKDRMAAAKEEEASQDRRVTGAENEVKLARQKLDEAKAKLEIDRQTAALQDAIAEGARTAKNATTTTQVGRNETEKLLREATAIGVFDRSKGLLGQFGRENAAAGAKGDTLGAAQAAAAQLELGNRLEQIGLTLQEHKGELQREYLNNQIKINEEASKALLTASREEQLRAAELAAFTRKNGPISGQEFQFLDKGTQEAMRKFDPQGLPPELKGPQKENRDEQNLLDTSLKKFLDAIQKTTGELERNVKLGVTPPSGVGANGLPVAITSPPINMQFADQFGKMVDVVHNTVAAALDAQVARMDAKFNAFVSSFHVGQAQSAGADTISG